MPKTAAYRQKSRGGVKRLPERRGLNNFGLCMLKYFAGHMLILNAQNSLTLSG